MNDLINFIIFLILLYLTLCNLYFGLKISEILEKLKEVKNDNSKL